MKVILREKVKSLGNVGEIVDVSAGYARNYLFPKALGVLASKNNEKELANLKKVLAKKIDEEKETAQGTAKKLQDLELEFFRKVGASGKLFGSVSIGDISRELSTQNIDVEKRFISLKKTIKTTGLYEAKVKLFGGVEEVFKVKVTMDPKQALEQKEASSKKSSGKRKPTRQKQEKKEESNPQDQAQED